MERADHLSALLASMDTLDAVQSEFAKEVAGTGGAAWAIERLADDVFFARQMARIVRPLLKAYENTDNEMWVVLVKRAHRDASDRLIELHGRHNSTSLLQNAVNQWEAEAMSKFVRQVGYFLQGD